MRRRTGSPLHGTRTTDASRRRPPTGRLRLGAVLVAAAAVLAPVSACSDGSPTAAPSPTRTAPASGAGSASATPDATSSPVPSAPAPSPVDETSTAGAPPFPADTSPDTADPSQDAMLTVTDVRIGRHDGFDRVVYELGGTGTPGWSVQYVEEAVQDGSGDIIDLAGDGTLQVLISGSAYPMDSGAEPFESAGPVTGPGTLNVTEARGWSVFEGITDAYVGVQSAAHPFRVYLLESPVRVVVDVADASS